jgi:hypothetical protein
MIKAFKNLPRPLKMLILFVAILLLAKMSRQEGYRKLTTLNMKSNCYGNRYPDLRKKYCKGKKCNTRKEAERLHKHWLTDGKRAGLTFGC